MDYLAQQKWLMHELLIEPGHDQVKDEGLPATYTLCPDEIFWNFRNGLCWGVSTVGLSKSDGWSV
jgi:hypothetical protein